MSEEPARPARRRSLDRRRLLSSRRGTRRWLVVVLFILTLALVGIDFVRHDAGGASTGLKTSFDKRDAKGPAPTGEESPPDPRAAAVSHTASSPGVVEQGPGTFTTVGGGTDVVGNASGEVLRYQVIVENDIGQDATEFARHVDGVLSDPRSWIAGGNVAFQRVDSAALDPSFVIYLASPKTVDQLCYPLNTNGYTSCRVDNKVVINLARWVLAVPEFSMVEEYRSYVVNHEVGHQLGRNHESCSGEGKHAPVMQQQTLGLNGCTPNPWPYVDGSLYQGPPA